MYLIKHNTDQVCCLQLFAVSLSLAPLIAMIILVIDIRVDAKRMLWLNRRPIAYIAQDIGKSVSFQIQNEITKYYTT